VPLYLTDCDPGDEWEAPAPPPPPEPVLLKMRWDDDLGRYIVIDPRRRYPSISLGEAMRALEAAFRRLGEAANG
jgi:hypothetical protein